MRKEENHIKSFVKRSGRLTNSQKIFLNNKNNDKNFFSANEILDFRNLFENNNKCILDVALGVSSPCKKVSEKVVAAPAVVWV